MKNRVLIIVPTYLPGFRSGGPQQTVQNICDVFKEKADIYLVTKNRDFGDTVPYDLETEKWLDLYGIKIMYVPPEKYERNNLGLFKKLYKEFDIIFACGLFCPGTISTMLVNTDKRKKVYVAPMGVFSRNALAIRGGKKRLFLKAFSALGLFRKIIWSFTSEEERNFAEASVGSGNVKRYIIAEDLPRSVDFEKSRSAVKSGENPLKIVFLSRIAPMKNLLYALRVLEADFAGEIRFDIYGVKEDQDYWGQCERELEKLPENVHCRYCGAVKPEESVSVFRNYDLFLLPTQGENFGHVIYEALSAGCLPVISDKTPWKDFAAKRCGNVIELGDMEAFRNCIRVYIGMPQDEWKEMKLNAIDYAERKYRNSVETSGYKEIFEGSNVSQ